ncbi:MAG: hypothetical protein JSS82_15165 [Bacteroidetes bacterium]|nr:hypothetical protein [Bacteroidota bacterium]
MTYPLTEEAKETYFKTIAKVLLEPSHRKAIRLEKSWYNQFDAVPGIYTIYEGDKLIYVGETGSIRGRMKDLSNTLNHTFRRTLGEKLFINHPNYTRATASKGYHPQIEHELNTYMQDHLSVCCLKLNLGRKEFEEWLQEDQKDIRFLNKRKARKK